ncbi:MAG TPA: signal peptidase I [Thermodesulfobacteriota bacterium]|nr:signal peptidase I [Thermodesulfobacteriota bacterium]
MQRKKFIKEYVEPIFIAVLIALFIRAFIVQAFKIPSSSMEPTLLVGDHILVNKFIYGIRIPYTNIKFFRYNKPRRGDIIVFIFPKDRSKDFIKRVIGLEGEKVEIINNKIYINDKSMNDPWGHFTLARPSLEDFGPIKIPEGSLFVMGDNRDNSQDSRFWGFVNINNDVIGKAFIIYYSGPNFWEIWKIWRWGEIKWRRIGRLIH